ncbi:MAG: hypothetical protein JW746_03640 [Candidatus Krumholzibacteriota bacterium]|nr:hypothetical protein [Candidatus Krumholzibacteriota bacterium]
MGTAEEDIQFLIQLIKKDLEIQKKKRYLDSTPGEIAELDKAIKSMDEKLKSEQDAVAALESEKRTLVSKVKSQNDEINKKKLERENLKTNKEYKAMGNEIEFLIDKVDMEEERIIAILDEIVEENKELSKIQEKINAEKDLLVEKKTGLEKGLEAERESLSLINDEKLRILPHLSEKVRKMYERILIAKGDSGVANLIGDICQGCYSRIPAQKAVEIRRNDKIRKCEYCGRILVYYEKE